jgi:hypothetical protein
VGLSGIKRFGGLEKLHSLVQSGSTSGERNDDDCGRAGQGILGLLRLLGVSTQTENSSRLRKDSRPGRDIGRDDGVRTDGRTVTDTHPAKNDTANPERHS